MRPLLILLSDHPNAERDRRRWPLRQQVALTSAALTRSGNPADSAMS